MFSICYKHAIFKLIAFFNPRESIPTTLFKLTKKLFAVSCATNCISDTAPSRGIQVSALTQSFCRLHADGWSEGFQVCSGAGVQWRDWAPQQGAGTRWGSITSVTSTLIVAKRSAGTHSQRWVGSECTHRLLEEKKIIELLQVSCFAPQKCITTNRDTQARKSTNVAAFRKA